MSPLGRSKGAVSISAKTIQHLVGGKSYRTKTVFDRFLEESEACIYNRVFVQPQGFNVRHGACEAVCGLLSLSADGLLCVGSVCMMVPAKTASGAAWVPYSARHFIFKNVDSPSAHAFGIPIITPPLKINQKSISIRTADRKTLVVKSWVGKGSFSTAFFA